MHSYTTQQIQFLTEITPGRSYAEITAMLNAQFRLSLSLGTVKGTINRYGLKNGRNGCFPPGNVPFNKGRKGISYPGMEATQFKPGQMPQTYRPVGTETLRADGYVWVKLADPKTWREKHVVVWEAAHGPRPKGFKILFGDGDRQNFALENLVLVSDKQLAVMNKLSLIGNRADLTRAGVAVADITMKITEKRKGRK